MNVLVACEFSGRVRDAFIARGHHAMSCDLEESETPGPHHRGDIRDVLGGAWDLMVAHPPCTRLANSGVHWLARRNLWDEMKEGARFFKMLWDAAIPRIAIENPIPHKYALEVIGTKYHQIIQPWQFGEDASKATCLWLKNLPPLVPTNVLPKGRRANQTPSGQNKLGPSPTRARERSRTYLGIAEAMASQWSDLHG